MFDRLGVLRFDDFALSVTWPTTLNGPVTVPPDSPPVPVAPGGYGSLTVFSRSEVRLKSGTYHFDTIQLEPQSVVRIDHRAGPVRIFFRGDPMYRGSFASTGDVYYLPGNLLVGYVGAGTPTLHVGSSWSGTLVAPGGWARIETNDPYPHHGAIFADSIEFFEGQTFIHVPFPYPWVG